MTSPRAAEENPSSIDGPTRFQPVDDHAAVDLELSTIVISRGAQIEHHRCDQSRVTEIHIEPFATKLRAAGLPARSQIAVRKRGRALPHIRLDAHFTPGNDLEPDDSRRFDPHVA